MKENFRTLISGILAKVSSLLVPSDWNASEGEPGHVLNRTHYEGKGVFEPIMVSTDTEVLDTFSAPDMDFYKISEDYVPITTRGQIDRVCSSDTTGTISMPFEFELAPNGHGWGVTDESSGMPMFLASDGNVMIVDTVVPKGIWTGIPLQGLPDGASVVMYPYHTIHKLDEKFLPNTVAKKNEVYRKDEMIGADNLPEIPVEKLPIIPVEKLPIIPVEKLPISMATHYAMSTIEWDGDIEGRDSIVANGLTYYKVSDLIIPQSEIPYVTTYRYLDSSETDFQTLPPQYNEVLPSKNATNFGYVYCIEQSGIIQDEFGNPFTAPSPGLYFQSVNEGASRRYCFKLEHEKDVPSYVIEMRFGRKGVLSVKDDGTLTVTAI